VSIPFLLDEKPTVVPVGSAGERSGGTRNVPFRGARSNLERAAPSACVGRQFCLVGDISGGIAAYRQVLKTQQESPSGNYIIHEIAELEMKLNQPTKK
jgi:hypothetical protein